MSPAPELSRRSLTVGGIAIAAAAAVAGAVYEVPKLFKPRARGQYADLVNLLDDPDQAGVVGRALKGFGDAEIAQADLKKRLPGRTLSALIAEDAARGQMAEADGWVIPATLAAVCILAAQSL